MAEIICVECQSTVSDESGYCPECGYPFDSAPVVEETAVVDEATSTESATGAAASHDIIVRSLSSIDSEMKELQEKVDGIRQDLNSSSISSAENRQKMLMELSAKLDAISSVQSTIKAAVQPGDPKKTKKSLIASFYKTLNSPNSMFEYMFYLCVVQVFFVIVILFMAAYIVTLVR
jgi:hypothetical protein